MVTGNDRCEGLNRLNRNGGPQKLNDGSAGILRLGIVDGGFTVVILLCGILKSAICKS